PARLLATPPLFPYTTLFRSRPALKPGAWRERPEPGAGVWFDLGPHLLDQAFVLFGTPRAVAADVRTERDGAAVDDAFDVTLHYRSEEHTSELQSRENLVCRL